MELILRAILEFVKFLFSAVPVMSLQLNFKSKWLMLGKAMAQSVEYEHATTLTIFLVQTIYYEVVYIESSTSLNTICAVKPLNYARIGNDFSKNGKGKHAVCPKLSFRWKPNIFQNILQPPEWAIL